MSEGRFITLEGPEGGGKSTQVQHLTHNLERIGRKVVNVRAPGGTPLCEYIRSALQHDVTEAPCAESEIMLFAAAHAQLTQTVIRPAVEAGNIVIADRYVDSMIVYQGYGRGLGWENISHVADIATGAFRPHKTILLDLDIKHGFSRIVGPQDRMERAGDEFHKKVREGFLDRATRFSETWAIVDGSQAIETVAQYIWDEVESIL
jgi:dTMP kinase